MQHPAVPHLRLIARLWPELDAVPGTRRRDPATPSETQRDARAAAVAAERADVSAGHVGRGASPAPGDIDQMLASHQLTVELCSLADRVAQAVQPPSQPSRVVRRWRVSLRRGVPSGWQHSLTDTDPSRWDYTWTHGAPWAVQWLLWAVADGVPPLVGDDITAVARRVLRRLEHALDGQVSRNAGRCTCGQQLTVAAWDDVITCPACRTSYARKDWLHLVA